MGFVIIFSYSSFGWLAMYIDGLLGSFLGQQCLLPKYLYRFDLYYKTAEDVMTILRAHFVVGTLLFTCDKQVLQQLICSSL